MKMSEAYIECAQNLLGTEVVSARPVRGTCVATSGVVFDIDTVGKNVHLTYVGTPGTATFGIPSTPSVCAEIVLAQTADGSRHLVGLSMRPVGSSDRAGSEQLEGTGPVYTASAGDQKVAVRAQLCSVALKDVTEYAD